MNMLDYFFYNRNLYAKQVKDDSYIRVAEPINEELIEDHLSGKLTLACYPLLNGLCTLGCIQLNYMCEPDPSESWLKSPRHSFGFLVNALHKIGILDKQIYSEWGTQGGTHLWLFFQEPVSALQVKQLLDYCLSNVNMHHSIEVNIYPSENENDCIRLPFAINQSDGNPSSLCDAHGNNLRSRNVEFNTISYFNFQHILRTAKLIPPSKYTPSIKQDLQCLLDECELISKCFSKPEDISDELLMGIGTNLLRLGDIGEEAWRYLNQSRMSSWDEVRFQQKLQALKYTGLSSCIKLNCYRRCMVGAPIRHLQSPKLNIKMQDTTNVTLEKIQDYYHSVNSSILNDYTPSIILNNGFPGLGKTHILADQLLTNNKYSVTWMAPNHIQAQQVMDIWQNEAVHLKSRTHMCNEKTLDCPHLDEINQAFSQGLRGGFLYCQSNRCEQFAECPYLKTYKKAQSARLVLCMHQHNMYGTVEELNKDILVIDENPAHCLRKNIRITTADIKFSLHLTEYIQDDLIRSQINFALECLKRGEWKLSDCEIWPIYGRDRMLLNIYITHASSKLSIDHGKWLLSDLEYVTDNAEKIHSTEAGYYYSRQSWIPKDRPVFVLDATLTVENLRMLLPDYDILTIDPEASPPQYCDVIHVIGATYGASTLFNSKTKKTKPVAKRLIKAIKDEVGENAAIISFKKLNEFAKLEQHFPAVGWYGNTRGLNIFSKYEKLVVLGFWMKPVHVMVREAFEHHGIPDAEIWKAIHQVELDLENPDSQSVSPIEGKSYETKKIRFNNPYIESYFNYSVLSELTQAVGRARVYMPSEKKREVWIITNELPAHVQITRKKDKKELIIDLRLANHKEAIKDAMKVAQDPTSPKSIHQTILMGGGKISIRTVKTYYKEFLEE